MKKQSVLTIADTHRIVGEFAGKLTKFSETTHECMASSDLPEDQIYVVLRVRGNFGVADSFFEALLVLGGHKEPREELRDSEELDDGC